MRTPAIAPTVLLLMAGETGVEPEFADNITTKNASAAEPAQDLVILVTSDGAPSGPDDECR
jgi:hypothetical protein